MADKLDGRYLVIKVSDVLRYTGTSDEAHLIRIFELINKGRIKDRRGILDGVFIERDWPEFKDAVDALLKRIGGN